MSDSILEARNLVRRYGSQTALDDVSFDIRAFGCVGLVGRNGAGKTTLLSLIAGMLRPDAGTLGLPDGGVLGLQPQEECFRRNLPVLQQLRHLQRLQGAGADAGEELDALLTALDAHEFAARKVTELSVGQRKRLNVLQAFLGQPDLILLDEPTAGLDPVAAAAVKQLIRARAQQATFLISSHNLYELQDLCRRVLVLDRGKLVNDIDLEHQADMDSLLKLKLDRQPGAALLARLGELPGITQITTDTHDARHVTVLFASPDPDQLQLALQSLITGDGCSILQLSRGKTLSDDMGGLQ